MPDGRPALNVGRSSGSRPGLQKVARWGVDAGSAGLRPYWARMNDMPSDRPTTNPQFRTPDLQQGRWTDLPSGWTQQEQPAGSGIWRRYRPLPNAKEARARELKRRRGHRYAAAHERTNYTWRSVVQESLDAVRAHVSRVEGAPCSEQRLLGRLAFSAASDLSIEGRVVLLNLPEHRAEPGREGRKARKAARASIPADDSDLDPQEEVVRFVGSRAEHILDAAGRAGLHPDAFMSKALQLWEKVDAVGPAAAVVALGPNARDDFELIMAESEPGATAEEVIAGMLRQRRERIDRRNEEQRREVDGPPIQ